MRKSSLVKRRTYRKKRTQRKRISRKRTGNVPEWASCSVARSMTASTVNQIYSLMNTQLQSFPRAVGVADAYQFYRIKKITLKVKSGYDTFANTGNAYQKPYFYYMIDKSGSIPTNISLDGLKQMGAKPRALDEKAIIISWRPSVLDVTATALGGAPVYKANRYTVSPWLSTVDNVAIPGAGLPSEVDHLGIYWGAFAGLTGAAPPMTYDVEVECQFEFKKPVAPNVAGAPSAIVAQFAEINSSVDGIVGGPDGDLMPLAPH